MGGTWVDADGVLGRGDEDKHVDLWEVGQLRGVDLAHVEHWKETNELRRLEGDERCDMSVRTLECRVWGWGCKVVRLRV